jgi:hypothetical protein
MKKDCSSLIGKRFGRLEVIGLDSVDKGNNRRWLCKCDCGKEKVVLGVHLKDGTTQSCTCLRKELKSFWNVTHGQSQKRTYGIWDGMRRRCQDPKNPQYKYYGAKGIKVCDKWQKFAGFFDDMGERPKGLTIERIDSKGNYEKSNCKWATMTENLRNRSCVKLDINKVGEIKKLYNSGKFTQKEIGKLYGVNQDHICRILNNKKWKNEI